MIILVILMMLTFYQDSVGFQYVGEIGRTPIFFLLPVFLWIEIKNINKKYGVMYHKISRFFNVFIKSILIISLLNVILYGVEYHDFDFLGENVLIKSFKYTLYYVTFILIFRAFYIVFTKISPKPYLIAWAVIIVAIIHIFVNVIEFIEAPNAFTWLHNIKLYYRVRLLTSEASWTSGIITVIFVLVYSFRKNKLALMVSFVLLGVYFFSTSSKTFLSSFFVAIFLGALYSKKISYSYSVTLLVISIIIGYFVLPILKEQFAGDLQEYTSTITRSTNLASAMKLSIIRPFGSGGLYFHYIIEELKPTSNFLIKNVFGIGDISELSVLGTKSMGDANISAGSMLGEWGACFGILGYYYYYKFFKIILTISKDNLIFVIGTFTLMIQSVFSTSIMTKWEWAIFLAFTAYTYDRRYIKR